MVDDDLQVVKTLFDQAGISMSDEEYERFGRIYRSLRSQADDLYADDLDQESPTLGFDPLRHYQ